DVVGGNTRSLEQSLERRHAEIDRRQRLKHSAVAPDRCAYRLADHGIAHQMYLPPVTSSTVPVMYDDRSEARNSATFATSAGSPARAIGTSASLASQIRCGMTSVI